MENNLVISYAELNLICDSINNTFIAKKFNLNFLPEQTGNNIFCLQNVPYSFSLLILLNQINECLIHLNMHYLCIIKSFVRDQDFIIKISFSFE